MTAPIRIRLSRAKGWRLPLNTVKVDRTTRWGNPFVCHRKHEPGRPECAEAMTGVPGEGYCCLKTFREWVASCLEGRHSRTMSIIAGLDAANGYPLRDAYVKSIASLRGKNLACWCPLDAPCHADVLLELANREPEQ